MERIYLDNAATTKLDKAANQAMFEWNNTIYGNPSSPHQHGQAAKISMENVRDLIAAKLNCLSKEIYFTSGGTESNNLAILGSAQNNKHGHIIVSATEHPSALETVRFLENRGYSVSYIKPNSEGLFGLEQIKAAVQTNTFLLVLMHINNETGAITPIKEIAHWAKTQNIITHCDAVQSFAKMAIDLSDMPVDFLSFSGHKIHGPKGVGGLFVRDGIKIEKLHIGGGQEANIRPGTENMSGIIGFGKALEQSRYEHWENVARIKTLFEEKLKSLLPKIILNSPQLSTPFITNIAFPGTDNQSMLLRLDMNGISASVGSACSSGSIKQSHVLQAMQLPEAVVSSALRFSFSKYTSQEEVELAAERIAKTAQALNNKK